MGIEKELVGSTNISIITSTLQSRIAHNCTLFGLQFPNFGEGKRYLLRDNVNWLAAFWPGILWLCTATNEEPIYRETAESLLPSFKS